MCLYNSAYQSNVACDLFQDVRLLLIVMIILIMLYIGFNGEKNKSRKRYVLDICFFCKVQLNALHNNSLIY